jgi:hypothetical protein
LLHRKRLLGDWRGRCPLSSANPARLPLVHGRPLDCFGVGCCFYNFSNELQDTVAPVASFKNEQGAEAYYVVAPAPRLHLSAHLQWVNPADGTDSAMWLVTCFRNLNTGQ